LGLPLEPVEVLLDGSDFPRLVIAAEVFEVVVAKVYQKEEPEGIGVRERLPILDAPIRLAQNSAKDSAT
jgi:hypothetical protein